jgi:hypothetical protein
VRLGKIVFSAVGMVAGPIAISAILGETIRSLSQNAFIVVTIACATAGGSILDWIGRWLFFRARRDASATGGAPAFAIEVLIILIVAVAGVLGLARLGLLPR